MTREVHYQSHLKSQGISSDFILHPEYYQICLLCSSQYGPNLKAIVLGCGHFLCENCLNRTDQCMIYTCLQKIDSSKNRIFVFNKNQLLDSSKPKKNKQYNITMKISDGTHVQTIEEKVQGSQKISDLIEKNLKIKNTFKGNDAILQMKMGSVQYNQIKDKQFDELA